VADAAVDFEYDKSVVGVEVPVGEYVVTREAIAQFNQAVGETNPLFTDPDAAKSAGYRDLVAPPTFYTVIRTQSGLDPNVQFGSTSFNAGQHCDFGAPICAGDTIKVKAVVSDVYAKTGRTGTMVFIVRQTFYENQMGERVASVEQSTVRRNMQGG